MVFSSLFFLLFFLPSFLLLYYLADTKYKNGVIVVFSLWFYMWGAPLFVFVIAGSIIADFFLSHKIYNSNSPRIKKRWLIFSVCFNVSILLYFKYANFFIENVNEMLISVGAKNHIRWTSIALPIGISFFTFHELSYIIDVYRGVNRPMKKIWDYAVYILLFPQLIAGPIVRYKEIAHQIIERKDQETIDNRLLGFFRFVIGLAKKVLIANVLGAEADKIFSLPVSEMSTGTAWLGIIAYSFQIYFDFSGYSDMAIGIARMIGITFPENFDNPYISKNITEFWRRWHMSLSRWMRDYLYIPLGGNKVKSKFRLYTNLWIVFLISGFWHGASWNFIIWGAYHGLFLIADRLFLVRLTEKLGSFVSVLLTYFIVLIGWVFFRAETLEHSIGFLQRMFAFDFHTMTLHTSSKVIFILFAAAIFSFFGILTKVSQWQHRVLFEIPGLNRVITQGAITLIFLFLCVSSLMSSGYNPFIYFRF